jgi:hypothetical protein
VVLVAVAMEHSMDKQMVQVVLQTLAEVLVVGISTTAALVL